MDKDTRRGVRRWRSYTKFMRRLKRDWNDHGWARGLDGKELCDCFDLTSKAAIRFKDTPKPVNCRCCSNQRRWGKGDERLTIEERRVFQPDESWHKKHRRDGTHPVKVICSRCGFHLKTVMVPNGQSGWSLRHSKCKQCAKKPVAR